VAIIRGSIWIFGNASNLNYQVIKSVFRTKQKKTKRNETKRKYTETKNNNKQQQQQNNKENHKKQPQQQQQQQLHCNNTQNNTKPQSATDRVAFLQCSTLSRTRFIREKAKKGEL